MAVDNWLVVALALLSPRAPKAGGLPSSPLVCLRSVSRRARLLARAGKREGRRQEAGGARGLPPPPQHVCAALDIWVSRACQAERALGAVSPTEARRGAAPEISSSLSPSVRPSRITDQSLPVASQHPRSGNVPRHRVCLRSARCSLLRHTAHVPRLRCSVSAERLLYKVPVFCQGRAVTLQSTSVLLAQSGYFTKYQCSVRAERLLYKVPVFC